MEYKGINLLLPRMMEKCLRIFLPVQEYWNSYMSVV
jgi:hypothetical protein